MRRRSPLRSVNSPVVIDVVFVVSHLLPMLRNNVIHDRASLSLSLSLGDIFDCVINVTTRNKSSPCGDVIDYTMVSIRFSDFASDALGFRVLGQRSCRIEVPEALLALKLLFSVRR